MARISTYGQDSTLNKADKVLGTDSDTGGTKNYTIESILSVANEDNLVEVFDGAAFEFKDYVDPAGEVNGVLNLNAGAATNAAFSAINVLYISVNDKSGNSLREYLENANNDFIKISKTDNLNQFGIYEVTGIEDYGSNKYKKLTLTPRGTNGTLTVGTKYFVANYRALYDQDFSDNSVTEFSDVTDAGSGRIITQAERNTLTDLNANALVHGDVVDNVTSTSTDVPLSANQGKVLKDLIDAINTLLTSDNVDLDNLQEVVDYIETNRSTLEALGISSITGLQAALDLKQNTETGKGLSTEDFTSEFKTLLEGITSGAEPNVQANWSETNAASDAFIQNKPTDLTDLSIHDVTELHDITSTGSGAIITGPERTKLTNIDVDATARTVTDGTDSITVPPANAEQNVQADWNEINTSSDAFILNKPTLAPSNAEQNVQSDWNETDTGADSFILNKPTLAPSNAEQNVQSDWNETDNLSDAFILNKPDITLKADKSTTITVQGTTNEIEVSPSTAQDLSANRTVTVGLPDDVTITNDLTVSNDLAVSNDITATNKITLGGPMEFTGTEPSTPTFDNGLYYSTDGTHDTLHFRYHGHDLSIDKFTEILPSGILNGGELSTTAGSTTFTIAAGNGIINDLNKSAGSEPHPEIINVEWAQQTITVFNLDSNNSDQLNAWIYIDNTGTVRQQAGAFTEAQFRTAIPVGSIIHTSGTTQFARTFPRVAYNTVSQHSEFVAAFGPLKISGHNITANGANLSVDRSAGVAFALGRNYATDPENPSTISDSSRTAALLHRYYSDGSSGFVKDNNSGAGYTVIDPTKYDDGTGTLATVPGGSYTAQRLFYFPGTPNILIAYYGKQTYSTLDTAQKSYLLEDFQEADNTAQQAIYVGSIIIKSGATSLTNTSDAKILTAGKFRSLAATNLGGVAASALLGDLGDVDVTAPSNNQVLQYKSASTNWEASTLNTDGVAEGSTNLYYTDARVSANSDVVANTAKVGITPQQAADIVANNAKISYPSADSTKVGHISITQPVDLDTIESNVATNNSKVTFPGFGTTAGTALEGDTALLQLGTTSTTALAGNTQFVDGSGTTGTLPKLSASDTITDSAISESGQEIIIGTTGAVHVPDGTTAERPSSPIAGMFRYNTDDDQFEGYTTEWGVIAGSAASVNTSAIVDDAVTFDKIENRYTAVGTITNTSGPTIVDWSSAAVYKMNAALTAAIEFDFTNYKAGQVLTIYNLSGSYTVTLDSDAATSESFLKLAAQDYDGSATSILQIECLADGNDAVFAYSVAQYASDNTI